MGIKSIKRKKKNLLSYFSKISYSLHFISLTAWRLRLTRSKVSSNWQLADWTLILKRQTISVKHLHPSNSKHQVKTTYFYLNMQFKQSDTNPVCQLAITYSVYSQLKIYRLQLTCLLKNMWSDIIYNSFKLLSFHALSTDSYHLLYVHVCSVNCTSACFAFLASLLFLLLLTGLSASAESKNIQYK